MHALVAKTPVYTQGPVIAGQPYMNDQLYTFMTSLNPEKCFCLLQYMTRQESGDIHLVSELYSDSTCAVGTDGKCNTEGEPLLRIVVTHQEDIMLLTDLQILSSYIHYAEYSEVHGTSPVSPEVFNQLTDMCAMPTLAPLMFGEEQMKYLDYWVKELPSINVHAMTIDAFNQRKNEIEDKRLPDYERCIAAMRRIVYSYYKKARAAKTVDA